MRLRSAALLVLFFGVTGCLVGRDLSLVEAEPQVSNIEAAPSGDDGGPPSDPNDPSESSDPSDPKKPGKSPLPPKDAGADATADASTTQDAGPAPTGCPLLSRQEAEPNNTQLAPNELAKGTTCGKLNVAGDEDWFTYDTGDAGGFLRLKFAAEGDAQIVVNNGGLTFAGGNGSAFNFISQGRWYIRIHSPLRQTPSYVITREL